jgi:acyl-CoA thioesterase
MSPAATPEETARRAADAMWAADPASRGLGMDLLAVGPGTATLAMTVRETMTNGHGTAHGGFIFALADSAFAFACNSSGESTVAAQCAITFLKPGRAGDRLIATAREVATSGRSGIYDVRITREAAGDTEVVAEFRGHSRRVGGSFLDGGA